MHASVHPELNGQHADVNVSLFSKMDKNFHLFANDLFANLNYDEERCQLLCGGNVLSKKTK